MHFKTPERCKACYRKDQLLFRVLPGAGINSPEICDGQICALTSALRINSLAAMSDIGG